MAFAADGGDPAVVLRGLGRAYGERVALAGVSLTLERGRTLAVFGANGAGKTTLLRVLATLLRPSVGSAEVLGRALPPCGRSSVARTRSSVVLPAPFDPKTPSV